ncbi:hypothetical protein Tdes44962_MAKER03539 [Teratosphaeria destructans]|uniref:Uncharacterized protein n=1 Tax=Teratosphaeria destructans TaxID=418781 RepID=A0A9W7SPY7_9PEZI|nr:hypothetical protein Tdes44962_MAKER03539 [Teratosphaeria destructans]
MLSQIFVNTATAACCCDAGSLVFIAPLRASMSVLMAFKPKATMDVSLASTKRDFLLVMAERAAEMLTARV